MARQVDLGREAVEREDAWRIEALKIDLDAHRLLPGQDRQAVAERSAQWNSSLRPNNPWELWLVERIAVESLRADRCAREESALRDGLARRAGSCWDDDRRAEAEQRARGLARDPAAVRAALEATLHGCDWLIARWGELIGVLDAGGSWDDRQAARARDLLGGPAGEGEAPATAERARLELDRLEFKRDRALKPLDAAARALAEAGMGPDPSGAIRRVRRYETSCLRRLEWAWSQLKKGRRDVPDPDREPRRPPDLPFEEGDTDTDADDDPGPGPWPAEWGSLGVVPPRRAAPVGEAGQGPGVATLAGALGGQARGPKPGGIRRSRRAARKR